MAERALRILAPGRRRRGRRWLLLLSALLLLLLAVFVMLAVPVQLQLEPEPERLTLQGFPPPVRLAGRFLVLPGEYRLQAERAGYRPLNEQLVVTGGAPADSVSPCSGCPAGSPSKAIPAPRCCRWTARPGAEPR